MARIAAGEVRWKDDNGRNHWALFYTAPIGSWGEANGFPYEIEFMATQEMRYARILGTVVYVAVDEDAEGKPVTEKWKASSKFYG
jgi:hypothetical protein